MKELLKKLHLLYQKNNKKACFYYEWKRKIKSMFNPFVWNE